jgi:hypothetical protein
MMRALREKVVVGPNGFIEIRSPEIPPPGTPAEVVVIFEDGPRSEAVPPMQSLIGAARGMFASADDADAYLERERDSWES